MGSAVSILPLVQLLVQFSPAMDETKTQRVTLQTLQPSAKVKGLVGSCGLVMNKGKDGALGKPRRKVSSTKITVFEDKSPEYQTKKPEMQECGVQTELETSEAIRSMISDDLTVEYWSTQAERRRLALTDALEENQQLHEEVDALKTELDSLKEENQLLKPLAEEAQYLAGVIKNLLGEDGVEGEAQNDSEVQTQ